ncbi:hypothetical protein BV898_19342 [Hypsibius exemplaris]|uniref:Uncharacterized protein n=1 Tax=Hypsibius exemplaris TaxID=2072580 RepID=A0A9X6NJ32_HYPEX|nr:hypothetical protein BV898_19342 [Hypsibius exemplaris]
MDQNHGGRIDDYIHSSYQVNRDVMDKSLKKAGQELKKNSTMSYVVKLGPGRERLPLNVNKYVPRDPRANATGGGSLFKPSVVGHGGKDPYWIEYEEIIENKKTKTKYEGLFEEKKNYMYNTPLELSMKNVIYYVRKNRVDLLTYMKFTICHVDKGPNNPALECEISMGFENAAEAKEFRKGKFHRLGGNELTVTNITVSKDAQASERPQILQDIEDQRPGVPGIFLVRGLNRVLTRGHP